MFKKEKIKENIIVIGSVVLVVFMFIVMLQLAFVSREKPIVNELPDDCVYVTHGIYETKDGKYVTLASTEKGKQLFDVSEDEFSVMMKYDVDYLTAKEILE